eukprot:4382962-Pleurochrysis_carterae.AAC.1
MRAPHLGGGRCSHPVATQRRQHGAPDVRLAAGQARAARRGHLGACPSSEARGESPRLDSSSSCSPLSQRRG